MKIKNNLRRIAPLWALLCLSPFARAAGTEANRVVVRTSDEAVFKGTFEDKDNALLTIKTDDGEELNLPISEIRTINGTSPQVFFKKFIPAIPDSLFSAKEISVNKNKVRMTFRFFSAWNSQKLQNGFVFSGPDDDRRWEGFRFSVILESPPSIQGELTYPSLLKKITGTGAQILSENYDTFMATQTMRTTEIARGNYATRSLRQIRVVNGEKCILEVLIQHQSKEKLNQPIAIAAYDKMLASIQFPPPLKEKPAAAKP